MIKDLNVTYSKKDGDSFERNLDKYVEFMSWARFHPDLFLDLLTPEQGGIRLDLDQRAFIRILVRFVSVYGVFPRGYGKTFVEILALILCAILYPNSNLSISAQTQANAVSLVEEKFSEIMRFFPLLKEEIVGKPIFSKDSCEIHFKSGSCVTTLANQQSSKGRRRHKLMMEESALINDALFSDVLEPIVNIPRRTIGRNPQVDPCEMNGQIHFLTTAYFKNSEFDRCSRMIDDMADLKGKFVIGSDWQLACEYGRGETRSQLLAKKESQSPLFFSTNYESKWVANSDSCIVDIEKLLALQVISTPELKAEGKFNYYIGVDVARSNKNSNNETAICVCKVRRDKKEKVKHIQVVNIVKLPNGTNFTGQAIAIKRIRELYKAVTVVVDINGLGIGLLDELMKIHQDPLTGKDLPAYTTINTEHESDEKDALSICWGIRAQQNNTEMIVNFIDVIEKGILQLLEKVDQSKIADAESEYLTSTVLPKVRTANFIEEVASLSLETLNGGKLAVRQNVRQNKDIYSSICYCAYYIMSEENKGIVEEDIDYSMFFNFSAPKIR